MFFGLCNSLATFQAMMNGIFKDMIDDIRKNLPGQYVPIIANWQHPPTSGYCVTDSCYCMYIVAPNMKGLVIS